MVKMDRATSALVTAVVTACMASASLGSEPLAAARLTQLAQRTVGTAGVTVTTFSGLTELQNAATKGYVGCPKPCSDGNHPAFNSRYPLSLQATVCNTTVRDIAGHCREFPHAVTLRSDAGLLRAYLQDTSRREFPALTHNTLLTQVPAHGIPLTYTLLTQVPAHGIPLTTSHLHKCPPMVYIALTCTWCTIHPTSTHQSCTQHHHSPTTVVHPQSAPTHPPPPATPTSITHSCCRREPAFIAHQRACFPQARWGHPRPAAVQSSARFRTRYSAPVVADANDCSLAL